MAEPEGGQDHITGVLDEVLLRVLGALKPEDFLSAESSCARFRHVVREGEFWRAACLRAFPDLGRLAIDMSQVPSFGPDEEGDQEGAAAPPGADDDDGRKSSAFYKKLYHRLHGPREEMSLVAEALAASSTDHEGEGVFHTLEPTHRSRNLLCYWSSAGSEDPGSNEALAYRLAHPLCRVEYVELRPFQAWFQWGGPVYAPQAVRFRLGGLHCFDCLGDPVDDGEWLEREAARDLLTAEPAPGPWTWTSPVFPVSPSAELQRFVLPGAPLCVGGYLRVELLGRRQRQEADDRYYTCLSYVRVGGFPVYNYLPVQPPLEAALGSLAGPSGEDEEATAPAAQEEPPAAQQQRQEPQQRGAGPEAGAAGRWRLQYWEIDALEDRGGLEWVSEGGRLVGLRPRGAPAPAEGEEEAGHGTDSESDSSGGGWSASDDEGLP